MKALFDKLVAFLLGPDVLTTLLGLGSFVVVEVANYLNALPVGPGWHYVALGLLAVGRWLNTKKPAAPAAPPAP